MIYKNLFLLLLIILAVIIYLFMNSTNSDSFFNKIKKKNYIFNTYKQPINYLTGKTPEILPTQEFVKHNVLGDTDKEVPFTFNYYPEHSVPDKPFLEQVQTHTENTNMHENDRINATSNLAELLYGGDNKHTHDSKPFLFDNINNIIKENISQDKKLYIEKPSDLISKKDIDDYIKKTKTTKGKIDLRQTAITNLKEYGNYNPTNHDILNEMIRIEPKNENIMNKFTEHPSVGFDAAKPIIY